MNTQIIRDKHSRIIRILLFLPNWDAPVFHKAKHLLLPDNIILLFQPAHSLQLNPIEQVQQYIKRRLRWLLPKNLDDLRAVLYTEIGKLTKLIIASIARRQYILTALSVGSFQRIGITLKQMLEFLRQAVDRNYGVACEVYLPSG